MAQRGGDAAAGLADEEVLPVVPDRVDLALMLVAPEHQVQEVRQELLGDVVGLPVFCPVEMGQAGLGKKKKIVTLPLPDRP